MIEKLGRYTLSIILSYLNEHDGVSFLLTNTRYTYQLLPLFRITTTTTTTTTKTQRNDTTLIVNNNNNNNNNNGTNSNNNNESLSLSNNNSQQDQQQQSKYIYKFVVSPIQDTIVLLQRLNTRKLYQQIRYKYINFASIKGYTIYQISIRQWNYYIEQYESEKEITTKKEQQEKEPANNNNINYYPPAYLQLIRIPSSSSTIQQQPIDNILYNIPTNNQRRTVIASYPRCGNTLVRTLIEQITGYITGSDTRPDRILSKQLSEQYNLIGEGITTLPIVKTHWPERIGCCEYNCHQGIIVVRNPYDAIDSYFNLNATCSHTKTVDDTVYEQYYDVFTNLVYNEINVWIEFYNYWCNIIQIPILIIRYEDLIFNPQKELQRIILFLLGKLQSDPLPLFWKHRIQLVTRNNNNNNNNNPTSTTINNNNPTSCINSRHNKLQSYQPRSSTSSNSSLSSSSAKVVAGRSLHRYTKELLDYIETETAYDTRTNRPRTRNYLQYFGYDTIAKNYYYQRQNQEEVLTTTIRTDINNNDTTTNNYDATNTTTTTNNNNVVVKDNEQHEPWRQQLFGIDQQQQQQQASSTSSSSLTTPSIVLRVNYGDPYARSNDCPYGRLFYKWRHSVTNNDTNPLPTISK